MHEDRRRGLSVWDGVSMTVGLVVGVGIFRTPSMVAANTSGTWGLLGAWALGAAIVACGAHCYGHLGRAHPGSGGEYSYLDAAFGRLVSFLFCWARVAVLQTGSLAATAFIFGDYASQLARLGTHSAMYYALAAVSVLTVVNLRGLDPAKWTQNVLTVAKVVGIAVLACAGLALVGRAAPVPPAEGHAEGGAFGLAMVFVLYTFGGWNEAAYLAGDLRRRNIGWVLGISTCVVAVIYLVANYAYVRALGLEGLRGSEAPAADMLRALLGEPGVVFVVGLTAIAALGSANATIVTGSRSIHALGADHACLQSLGSTQGRGDVPANAYLLQGAVTVALILLAGVAAGGTPGFDVAVAYTAPAFWGFMLLVGLAGIRMAVRSHRGGARAGLTASSLVLSGMCGYMLYSSLAYAGLGAALGAAIVLAGLPVYVCVQRKNRVLAASEAGWTAGLVAERHGDR